MHPCGKRDRNGDASGSRFRVLTIYAFAFLTPAMYRGASAAAEAFGFDAVAQLTVGYITFGVCGLATWALATGSRWAPTLVPITAPGRSGLPSDLRNPIIIILAASAIITTSMVLGPFGKDAAELADSAGLGHRLILAAGAALVVPVTEEIGGRWLLYRGLRPTRANDLAPLQRLRTTAPAALMSGAAFGLFHYMVAGPTRMAITAIVGVILAVSYEWSGTLAVPIAVHIYINANARLTTEFGSAARYIGIVLVLGLALRAFLALARMRTGWSATS